MFDIYRGKRVFVTGHTGFKGSWPCELLLAAGAEVHGFALPPPTRPALFSQLGLSRRIVSHTVGDIRDAAALEAALAAAKPDFVFHLAAQAIVRESYRVPRETFETNVMGTVNLLEAVRQQGGEVAVVCVTTDKVYENNESGRAFREDDPLGGHDPYSASKGACEIAISSYRRSFFAGGGRVRLASARAGNVIGGGDWAKDRIVPDAMRAFLAGRELVVRNARSIRPWQHVLEPLSGYLALGAAIARNDRLCGAYNFGPPPGSSRTVASLAKELARHFPHAAVVERGDPRAPAEAGCLRLDPAKAVAALGWRSRWGFKRTVAETAAWYKAVASGESARAATGKQIEAYFKD